MAIIQVLFLLKKDLNYFCISKVLMKKNWLSFSVILVLLFSLLIRIYGILQKENYSYDESNSFITITINEQHLHKIFSNKAYPYGQIVKASEWENHIYGIKEPFNLIKLKNEIPDNISPLYYWLLHIVFAVFGVNMYNGLWVNLIIFIGIFVMIYLISKKVFISFQDKLFVLIIFSFSYAVLQINFEARQHGLFALISLIYFYFVFNKLLSENYYLSIKDILIITVITTLGMLTLITFLFPIAIVCGLSLLICRFNLKNLSFWKVSISSLTGIILSEIIYPFFTKAASTGNNYREMAIKNFHGDIIQMYLTKIKVVIYYFFQFFSYNKYIVYTMILFSISLFLISIFLLLKEYFNTKKINIQWIHLINLFWIFSLLIMSGLYILSLIPPTAVGEQYYLFIYAFFSISFIYYINKLFPKIKLWVKIIVSVIVIISGITSYSESYYLRPFVLEKKSFNNLIQSCDLIVIKCIDEGDLGRIVTQVLPKNSNVLVITDESIQPFIQSKTFKKIALLKLGEKSSDIIEQIPNYKYKKYKFNSEYNSEESKRIIYVYSCK